MASEIADRKRVYLEFTPEVHALLEEIALLGIHGATVQEVCERMVLRGLEALTEAPVWEWRGDAWRRVRE